MKHQSVLPALHSSSALPISPPIFIHTLQPFNCDIWLVATGITTKQQRNVPAAENAEYTHLPIAVHFLFYSFFLSCRLNSEMQICDPFFASPTTRLSKFLLVEQKNKERRRRRKSFQEKTIYMCIEPEYNLLNFFI